MTAAQNAHARCAELVARYTCGLRLEDVPGEVVAHARYLLLDLIGAALAGSDTPEVVAAERAAGLMCPTGGPCTLWGSSHSTSPTAAALVNGIAAHARELDDFGGVDHTGAVVVPALLAVAEAWPVLSGKRLLEAMVVGYEVGRRVLDAAGGYRPLNHNDGWHSTGVCGSFAAAAAAAKALALEVRQTTWALGLSGSFTGGTWAFSEDGAMSKRYHAGRAAETGLVAVCLARSGFSGPAAVFEAPWGGFFRTYARSAPRPEELLRNLGHEWGILRSGIKPYAACRDIHSTLDVILRARREHGLVPHDVAAITVRCTPQTFQMVGRVTHPQTRLEAQLSLSYSIGAALVTGRAGLAEYEPPLLHDKAVLQVAARVTVSPSPDLPLDAEPYITIITRDGRQIEGHVDFASGAPQNPLPPDVIEAKFQTLGKRVLSDERVAALQKLVLAIGDCDDVRAVVGLLRTAPR
jgi:2-methylcitrate dehydratase PrpD